MRGLTRLEREILAARACDAPRYAPVGDDDPRYHAQASLARVGRVVERECFVDGEVCDRAYITDLGRLALRVCPADESV